LLNKLLHLFLLIFIFVIFLGTATGQPSKSFYEMTHLEIDSVIRQTAQRRLTVTEKMNVMSEYFLGMPYNLKCVGDGPYALLEPWPLVNFKETNCMALCEHVLALAISDNWDNFFNNLQHIRYQDGLIGMKTRNHYTMADWLPQNSWLLTDVTAETGGKLTQKVTRTISHRQFFVNKGISDMSGVKPDREITQGLADGLRTGDILALLYANLDNIFSAHMVMVANKNGKKVIRESSNSKMTTFDTPLDKWIHEKLALTPQRYMGIAVMRVKNAINKKGKIIYPSNIKCLKDTKLE